MADLTENTPWDTEEQEISSFETINDAVQLYQGSLVGIDTTTGFIDKWSNAAKLEFLGVADEKVLGDTSVTPKKAARVIQGRKLKQVTVTGVSAATDKELPVYATDDNTLTLTQTSKVGAIGRVTRWYSSTTADVQLFTREQYKHQKRAMASQGAGGTPFVVTVTTVSGTNNYSIFSSDAPFAFRVVDAWAVKTGGAGGGGDTVKVDDGTTDITDAMDVNDADKVISRITTIDDSKASIARGGSLRVVAASDAIAQVYVLCVPE